MATRVSGPASSLRNVLYLRDREVKKGGGIRAAPAEQKIKFEQINNLKKKQSWEKKKVPRTKEGRSQTEEREKRGGENPERSTAGVKIDSGFRKK